ncbi:hypothetical protein MKX01_030370, partial [Papaver californicum]
HDVGDKDGVIIVDHGFIPRPKESNLLIKPSIKDAFDSCERQVADRVIVSPYFLSPGRHWKQDIPSLTAEASKEHPGVTYMITPHLGLHGQIVVCSFFIIYFCLILASYRLKASKLVFLVVLIPYVSQIHEKDLMNDRIKHCIRHVAGDAEERAVCVGTGKCRLYHVESYDHLCSGLRSIFMYRPVIHIG